MGKNTTIDGAYITDKAIFYSFVLVYFVGVRWSISATVNPYTNDKVRRLTRDYLDFVCGDDEWLKRQVIDASKDQSRASIRAIIRRKFRSLFHTKRMKSLQVPDELEGQDVTFSQEYFDMLRQELSMIKREINMANEETEVEVNEEVVTQPPQVSVENTARQSDSQPTNSADEAAAPVTVNFFIPSGVDASELTLDNYRELTGKRFRMTKEQKTRGVNRTEAFEESKQLAIKLANGGN